MMVIGGKISDKLLLLLCFFGLEACLANKVETFQPSESFVQATQSIKPDFCDILGDEPRIDDAEFWNASMVQKGLSNLIEDSKLQGTPWIGYPVIYLKMTEKRDEARCHGILKSDSIGPALINHQLADNMTRFYITITKLCVESKKYLAAKTGLCGQIKAAHDGKYSPIESAMATTAVYISSHLAESLAAVILDDRFWSRYPVVSTHMPAGPLNETIRKRVLGNRIVEIRLYKSLFDKFNDMLGESITMVANALKEKGLLSGPLVEIELLLAQLVPCKKLFFGRIRDQAFEVAQLLALDPSKGPNPMMLVLDQRHSMSYGRYDLSQPTSVVLQKLEKMALDAIANPMAMMMYRTMNWGGAIDQKQIRTMVRERCEI